MEKVKGLRRTQGTGRKTEKKSFGRCDIDAEGVTPVLHRDKIPEYINPTRADLLGTIRGVELRELELV